MSFLESAEEQWPTSGVSTLPLKVQKGRRFTLVRLSNLPEFIGDLFHKTDYQSIRLTISRSMPGFCDVFIEGTACPVVPYATLSGEHLHKFIDFSCVRDITLWVHSGNWFWVADIEDDELEKIIDAFINSLKE